MSTMPRHRAEPQTTDREGENAQPDRVEGDFLAELLRFEELITNVSSKLMAATCDQVDQEIERALTEIRCFLRVDRCGLLQVWPDKQCFRITHASFAENISLLALDVDFSRELFPWCYRKLFERQEVVSVETLDDLPPEAVTDKKSCREWRIRSFLDIPIILDGTVVYAIVLNAVEQERMWPREFTPRLALLGEILVNALERRKKSLQTEERLQFEKFLSNLSAKFVNLPADQVNAEIQNAQQRLCEFLGLDRSTLWQPFVDDQGVMRLTHIYQPADAPPVLKDLEAQALFPWTIERVLNGEVVRLTNMADLPPEAAQDRESYRFYLTKSALVLPLRAAGTIIGAVSFATIREEQDWPDDLFRRLQLMAEVFANAVARKNADQELQESRARLRLAAESAGTGLWKLSVDTGLFWATDVARDLFGFAPGEDLTFDKILTYIHPEDRERVRRAVNQAVQSAQDLNIEYRVQRPDGVLRWLISRGRPYFDSEKRAESMLGVTSDITSRKLMEEQLEGRFREIESLKRQLQAENIALREEVRLLSPHEEIVGKSAAMHRILVKVEQVAPTNSTVLLTGETGTGKGLIAQAIHDFSKRKDCLLVKVNCASLPSALIENELFGREKGAYTGALARQIGRFELANKSTLFLDEVAELPLELQAKLLRVLESGEFERLGSSKTIRVDVRFIAASNRDIAAEVRRGAFRRDLYYRLNVFPIEVPPLRDRTDDIPLLVDVFVKEFSRKMGKTIETVPRKALDALKGYPWPGNIRELRNVIEHAVIVTSGPRLKLQVPEVSGIDSSSAGTLEEAEYLHIMGVLKATGWRIKGHLGAAELLGMKPSTLYAKMKRLGILTRTERGHLLSEGPNNDLKTK